MRQQWKGRDRLSAPGPRRAYRTGALGLAIAALGALSLASCGGSDPAPRTGPGTPAGPISDAARTTEPATSADGTPIRITIGTTVLTGHLRGNPTAGDLVAQLPLTLTFQDLNGVEKIARLPRALTMDGVPAGDDPEIGDVGYYAPTNNLVLYYGDVGYWNGIVRIGEYDGIESVQDIDDGATVMIERAS
jgi:hypothetical protein